MTSLQIENFEAAVERAKSFMGAGRRVIGIVGKPGAGKSTLGNALVETLGEKAALLSLDGFHLSNPVLESLSAANRKGAPHTFDVQGYSSLLKRLRSDQDQPIYFPVFNRTIEESVAAQGVIRPGTELVITEGNYLLLETGGWESIQPLLDEVWFIEIDDELRLERLIARHVHYGRSLAEAENWARGTDEQNAILIGQSRDRADVTIYLS